MPHQQLTSNSLLVLFLVTFVVLKQPNLVSSDINSTLSTTTTTTNTSKPTISLNQSNNINNNSTSRESNSSSSPGAIVSEQLLLGGKCAIKSTCKLRGRRLELDGGGGSDKRSCYCDDKCFQYDDCCLDSAWSRPFKQRIDMGLIELRQARKQWHCHRVNPIFGDILLRAACSLEWLVQHDDKELAEQVRRRCEYVKDRGKMAGGSNVDYQTDPVGMMMPITDLTSGITYANSYCLRCNRLRRPKFVGGAQEQNKLSQQQQQQVQATQAPAAAPKLIYWSPLLTCNYNLETDERNTLYDLISANKGQVLKYSSKRNKWIIDAKTILPPPPPPTTTTPTTNFTTKSSPSVKTTNANEDDDDDDGDDNDDLKNERVCSITPTIPDSVEHIIRYCRSSTIDTCLPNRKPARMDANRTREYESQKLECHFGHQALVYSQTSDLIYFNLACAKCNQEKQVFCEPKLRKDLGIGVSKWSISSVGQDSTRILSAPSDNTDGGDPQSSGIQSTDSTELPPGSSSISINKDGPRGADAGEAKSSSAFSGSFSILIDLYGSSQGDELVGSTHQCPDMENEVYDPFHNVCRDIVCGLKQKSVDGKCVGTKEEDPLKGSGGGGGRVDVVDKFKPAMVYLTTVCLIISIASLSMYLALYCLSMLDLRKLIVDMAQANHHQAANHHMDKHRASKSSSSSVGGSQAGSSRESQSLASRGVACLSASLLTAYIFFILGHQSNTNNQIDPASLFNDHPMVQLHLTAAAASNHNHPHPNQTSITLTCLALALGTYYCFLVAFNWMFLLSYDIWRTLRLATRQLRGPAMHSQSKRFLSYTLFSLLVSGLIVAAATIVDQATFECSNLESNILISNQLYHHHNHHQNNITCSQTQLKVSEFVHTYKPKFGQRAGSCWFSNRRSLALFFGTPVALIMFLNLLFFLHSSYMVIRTSTRSSRHKNSSSVGNGQQQQQQQRMNNTGSFGHHNNLADSDGPKLISVIMHKNSISSPTPPPVTINNGNSFESKDTSDSCYVHQNSLTTNSMISVQTIQSHLSSSCAGSTSSAEEEFGRPGAPESPGLPAPPPPQRPDGAPGHQHSQPSPQCPSTSLTTDERDHNQHQQQHHHQLVATKSSSSLTNQSIGGVSLSTSLASKYDSKVQQLGTVMGSVVKDYRLYCRLSTIMGLTWLTGLMASVVDQSDALWYVFVVLNTLQGLFIFIAFGCKRSKLNNLEILLNYCQFRWRQLGEKCTRRKEQNTEDNEENDNRKKENWLGASGLNRVEDGEAGKLQEFMESPMKPASATTIER